MDRKTAAIKAARDMGLILGVLAVVAGLVILAIFILVNIPPWAAIVTVIGCILSYLFFSIYGDYRNYG